MYLSYPDLIGETAEELRSLERAHRGTPLEVRLKMLRLLKDGSFRSRSALSEVLGYSERQMDRWFQAYREKGLDGLLDRSDPGGSSERVTPEAWEGLCQQMIEGRIRRLEDAQRYLADEHEIHYAGISSISMLFQRRGVKLKTGRKEHRKADPAEQAAFKK